MSADRTKVSLLLISDTHTAALASNHDPHRPPYRIPLPKADILIHSGDLTMQGDLPEYETTLAMLASADAELKLVIAGNHDLTLDREYMLQEMQEQPDPLARFHQAEQLWKGPAAKQAGVTYLDEGTHSFALRSGARFTVYASPYTPAFCNMAFPYHRHQDRWSPAAQRLPGTESIAVNPIPDDVDIVVTHGPPMYIMDGVPAGKKEMPVGCKALMHAMSRTRPRLHVFGHIHEGWGVERVQWGGRASNGSDVERFVKGLERENLTKALDAREKAQIQDERCFKVDATGLRRKEESLFVNAAIMDVQYRPLNAPILVDLDLPRSVDKSHLA